MELTSDTINWAQQLDRSFVKSLKSAWNKEVDSFIHTTGVAVGHEQFLKTFVGGWSCLQRYLMQFLKRNLYHLFVRR